MTREEEIERLRALFTDLHQQFDAAMTRGDSFNLIKEIYLDMKSANNQLQTLVYHMGDAE